MDMTDDAKPLTLDGQYITLVKIETIRYLLLDLFDKHYVMIRVKSYSHLIHPEDEINHLRLLDHVWQAFGELELIDLNRSLTLVRFYGPGLIRLSEIEEHESALRKFLTRPRIEP